MDSAFANFDDADLNGFVDGRLEPSRGAALAQALAGDAEARARIDGWKRQNDALRSLFASVLFEPVPVRLLPVSVPASAVAHPAARFEALKTSPAPQGRTASIVVTTSVGMALVGFVIGVLASLGTGGFGMMAGADRSSLAASLSQIPVVRDLEARAAEAHDAFLAGLDTPSDIRASDAARLPREIQRRLGANFRVPDLRRQGWTFMGGRLLPGQNGTAVYLTYSDGADHLGLYMARLTAPVFDTLGVVDGKAAAWVDGDVAFGLATTRDSVWFGRNGVKLRDEVNRQSGPASPPPL